MFEPFSKPVYVVRPLLPDLSLVTEKLKEVWESQCLTNMGAQHKLLESKLKNVLNVPNLSLFNNGTIALMIACRVLGLKGEVITTPFTFPATVHSLAWNNITPVFCDIDPVTMNIDADKIEALITPKTTAILAVHVFGTPCDVEKIQKIADKHGLKVIYDAAHAFGVEIDGKAVGSFGDISMFSFHATKLFHTAEGGALVFKDDSLVEKINLSKNFGIKNENEVVDIGINGKMNEVQAVIGLVVLDSIQEEWGKRKKLFDVYERCLSGMEGVTLLKSKSTVRSSYQYLVIRINKAEFGKSRDFIHEEFKKYNVFTRKYFYPLCSSYPDYKNLSSSASENLQVANQVVDEVLCVPFYGNLAVEDVEKICNILKSFKD